MLQRILVLSANGYIGRHLVQTLSQQGYQVLTAARRIEQLEKQQLTNVSCHKVDLNRPDNLTPLLKGVGTAYYLVYGMGEGGDFIAHKRQVTMNVRDTLRNTPVKQLIFLSSLQAPRHERSDHLHTRQITVGTLRESGVPMTELHAGVIVGAGPAAFEIMHDVVCDLPVFTSLCWVYSRTTSVVLGSLVYYLMALLENPTLHHRVLETAGPQVLSYQEQLEHFIAVSGKHRLLIPIPFPTRWISV